MCILFFFYGSINITHIHTLTYIQPVIREAEKMLSESYYLPILSVSCVVYFVYNILCIKAYSSA